MKALTHFGRHEHRLPALPKGMAFVFILTTVAALFLALFLAVEAR